MAKEKGKDKSKSSSSDEGRGPYYVEKRDGSISQVTVMRPGKTARDKRRGSWASKQERNARQAAYREKAAKTPTK